MIAHSRTPSRTPNPMPTLAAENSPADLVTEIDPGEDAKPELLEAETNAEVLVGRREGTTKDADPLESRDLAVEV